MRPREAAVKRPTLVTGTSIPDTRLAHQRAFTLWEMLMVVAIIAITVSLVQLSAGLADNNRHIKNLGKGLGKLIQLLNQEAVFENRNFALALGDNKYAVLEYNGEDWALSDRHGSTLVPMRESQVNRLIIDDLVIDTSAKNPVDPHILILSSGEMTPFEWQVDDAESRSRIVLQGSLTGQVLMSGPEPLE